MKKNLQMACILGMLCLCTSAFAQNSVLATEKIKPDTVKEKPHFELLLNLVSTNLNYGKANNALSDNKRSVLGAQLGVSFQTGIAPKVSLVSEFYFMMKGGKLKADDSPAIPNTTLRFYTLESPLLARYYFGNLYVNAGPSIAYNFYGTRKVENTSADVVFNKSDEGYQRWDAGLQVGAGYKFHFKQKIVGLDVRYSYGLSNVSNGQEMHNRYLNIGIHFSKAR